MENRTITLTTDSLNYDRVANLGYFFDGGTLMDEENVLTSDWGEYSPATKLSVFNYEVQLVNPKFTLKSDTLCYNTATKIANIVGPSDIDSEENHIYSELGFYDTQLGRAELLNRSVLTNGGKRMTGDSLFYDRNRGIGEAFNDVVFVDTIDKNMLTGNYCFYNQMTSYAFATDEAVATDFSQGDSLFIHADTLEMFTYNLDTDSVYREARAFHKVRVYRTDVQAVCDSLVFSSKDSCLTMYRDPILWNKQQQLLGEEIRVYMNDSTIDWAHIWNQALSVERIDSANYNQVSGKEMKAFFEDGKIRKVDVLNSVRLIYYPMESDSTLIGMVTAESSELNAFLEDMKLKTVVMKPKTNGVMYPMDQLPPAKMRLDNFGWFDYIRPLNKKDIFNWRGKKAGQELKKTTRGNAPLPNQNLFENNKKK
jgi:lipopolysaccharide export system protein LptA